MMTQDGSKKFSRSRKVYARVKCKGRDQSPRKYAARTSNIVDRPKLTNGGSVIRILARQTAITWSFGHPHYKFWLRH